MTTAELGQEPVKVKDADEDDLTLWSVTTILGCLDKPALLYWAAGLTADAAIDNVATWQSMLEERGREETWKWLRDARNRPPKDKLSATDLGTVAHKVCETYALTGVRPDKDFVTEQVRLHGTRAIDLESEVNTVGRMLQQFDGWLQRFTPSYQATEVCVYSPLWKYAGQADGFMNIDGHRFIFDYKTSRETYDKAGKLREPYPEVALQLAAYRYAEYAAVWRPRRMEKMKRRYYLLSPAEREMAVPVPEVDAGLVIKLTPESCEAYPVKCDREIHRRFGFLIETFEWVHEVSGQVIGRPLCR